MEDYKLKFDANGLIPTIVQQHDTKEVLMMAYMNEESIRRTMATGTTWFWSRSRNVFWNKGATSGNTQNVKQLLYDCDQDTLLVLVDQVGEGACHTGNRTCFYREIPVNTAGCECPSKQD